MGFFIKTGASTWDEISGTQKIHVKTGASTWDQVEKMFAKTGATTWTQIYQFDNVGPTGGGVSALTWTQGLPGFTVAFNSTADAESGVASYFLQVSTDGSIYSTVTSISTAGGSTTYSVAAGQRGVVHYFRTVAVDNAGNATFSAATSGYAKPLGTFTVLALTHGTWISDGAWRSPFANLGIVPGGWIGTQFDYQYGHWFYGSGVSSVAKGYVPDSGTIRTFRSSADGCSGAVVAFATHNHGSVPAGNPGLDTAHFTTGTSQTQGNAKEFTLSAATLARIAVDANFGMFLYPGNANGTINATASSSCASGTTYRVFNSPVADANSGRLTLVFN